MLKRLGTAVIAISIFAAGVWLKEHMDAWPIWLEMLVLLGGVAVVAAVVIGVKAKPRAGGDGPGPNAKPHAGGDGQGPKSGPTRPRASRAGASVYNVHREINERLESGADWTLETVVELDGMIEWLDANPDPAIWLEASEGINYDLEISWDILKHMLAHPACGQSLAVAALCRLDAAIFFGGDAHTGAGAYADTFEVVGMICERAAGSGFVADQICDPRTVDRTAQLGRLASRAEIASPHFPAPLHLLGQPPGRDPRPVPFYIDETGVHRLV